MRLKAAESFVRIELQISIQQLLIRCHIVVYLRNNDIKIDFSRVVKNCFML